MKKVVLAVGAAAAMLLPAAQAGTLDQSHRTDDVVASAQSGNTLRLAQSFTVGLSGMLDQVDLKFGQGTPAPSGPGTVEIRAASGGLPTGPVLATGTMSLGLNPSIFQREIPLTPAIAVTAGQQYAIIVVSSSSGNYDVRGSSTNTYAGGQASQSSSGGSFTAIPAVADFWFKTYVKLSSEDQKQEVDDTNYAVRAGAFSAAQTFTVGKNGQLDRVDVRITRDSNFPPAGVLTFQIRNVTAGAPGSTIHASTTVPFSTFSDPTAGETRSFIPATFAAPVTVTTGTQLALVVRVNTDPMAGPTGTGGYLWGGTGTDPSYAGGVAFTGNAAGTSWSTTQTVRDLAFRTYVTTPSAVGFRSATATRTAAGVRVRWSTGAYSGVLGYDVYREVNGARTRVTKSLIAANARGSYTFVDRRAPLRRAVRYWVQAVRLDGSRSWHLAGSVAPA